MTLSLIHIHTHRLGQIYMYMYICMCSHLKNEGGERERFSVIRTISYIQIVSIMVFWERMEYKVESE